MHSATVLARFVGKTSKCFLSHRARKDISWPACATRAIEQGPGGLGSCAGFLPLSGACCAGHLSLLSISILPSSLSPFLVTSPFFSFLVFTDEQWRKVYVLSLGTESSSKTVSHLQVQRELLYHHQHILWGSVNNTKLNVRNICT